MPSHRQERRAHQTPQNDPKLFCSGYPRVMVLLYKELICLAAGWVT